MSIIQGDNGIVISFNTRMNLAGATVTVSIKRGTDLLTKPVTITDSANGLCNFSLLTSDITIFGVYKYQWTATYDDGRIKSGKALDFYVDEKLATGTNVGNVSGDITVTVDGGDLG